MSITEEQKKKFVEFFEAADTDNDGEITIIDFAREVRKLKCYLPNHEIVSMFVDVNKKRDSVVDREEFMAEMMRNDRNKKIANKWKDEFDMVDTDKDGFISHKELETFLRKVNREEDVDLILQNLDKDKDGKISYKEFLKDMPKK